MQLSRQNGEAHVPERAGLTLNGDVVGVTPHSICYIFPIYTGATLTFMTENTQLKINSYRKPFSKSVQARFYKQQNTSN